MNPPSVVTLSRLDELEWQPFRAGIEIYPLSSRSDQSLLSAFLRYSPGASVPQHEHPGYEQILVLSGSQEDDAGVYPAGTLYISKPGTRHSVRSPNGCVVLAYWEAPVVFL